MLYSQKREAKRRKLNTLVSDSKDEVGNSLSDASTQETTKSPTEDKQQVTKLLMHELQSEDAGTVAAAIKKLNKKKRGI